MDIRSTTAEQFDRASKSIEQFRPLALELELALRFNDSPEFHEWLNLFEAYGIPPERITTILAVGIELGYALRVEQEKSKG